MNWATTALGTKIVDCSSQVEGGEAHNVLEESNEKLWLSKAGTPQSLSISLANVDNIVIRTVGWYCWHSYCTNPRVVSVHVSTDGSHFRHWDTFTAKSQTRGNQLFSCAPIDTSLYPFIAFEVNNTFGGLQTYMNRLYLYSDEISASPDSSLNSRTALVDDSASRSSAFENPNPQAVNMSELSFHSAEPTLQPVRHRGQIRISTDTDVVAQQLQEALGISDELDDSFVEYEHDGEVRHEHEGAERSDTAADRQTVASRVAVLEDTVNHLTHTVQSLSRCSSPQRDASGRIDAEVSLSSQRTPAVTDSPNRRSRHGGSALSSRSPARSGSASLDRSGGGGGGSGGHNDTLLVYEERIQRLEGKFDAVLQVLEQRQAAGLPLHPQGATPDNQASSAPRRPPQPPPPPTPPRHPSFPPGSAVRGSREGWTNPSESYTSVSNVSNSIYSSSGSGKDAHQRTVSGATAETRDGAASVAASGASMHDVEQVLRRVLQERSPGNAVASTVDPCESRVRAKSRHEQSNGQRHHHRAGHDRSVSSRGTEGHRASHSLSQTASTLETQQSTHSAHRRDDRVSRSRERYGVAGAGHEHREYRRGRRLGTDSTSGNEDLDPTKEVTHRRARGDDGKPSGGVRYYVAQNAERLAMQERVRESLLHAAAHRHREHHGAAVAARRLYEEDIVSRAPSHAGACGSLARGATYNRESTDSDIESDAIEGSAADSDSGSTARTERLRQLRAEWGRDSQPQPRRPSGQLEHERKRFQSALHTKASALDKSIFELLKVKYGLEAEEADGDEAGVAHSGMSAAVANPTTNTTARRQTDAGSHGAAVRKRDDRSSAASQPVRSVVPQPATLPMHVPIASASHADNQGSGAAVVDWGQYIQNRVASRSASPSVPASPLRPGTRGVYTVAGVVVNSSDHIDVLARAKHDQRAMRRSWEQKSDSGSVTGPAHTVVSTGSGEEDADFQALVRQLHAKVLERTIKEAQYDMLRMSEGALQT